MEIIYISFMVIIVNNNLFLKKVYLYDRKKLTFIIMAFMMSFGIIIRVNNIFSDSAIAFFYTGLGFALLLSGLSFIYNYAKIRFAN